MTKIAVITDTHLGARNDDINVYRNMVEFFEKIFFPTLKERGIKDVIHMGDIFDRKKFLNTQIVWLAKRDIFEELSNYDVHFIIGNHDCYYKSTNVINSSKFLMEYPSFKFYAGATRPNIKGFKPLFLPWIARDNHEDTMKMIEETTAQIVFGHLEIAGYEHHTGNIAKTGLSKKIFEKFSKVYSGHFHKRNGGDDIIQYLGSPYQTSWAEADQMKGFHIFDTETHEMEFIPNPNNLFIEIDDKFDFSISTKGKYVKIATTEEAQKSLNYGVLASKLEEEGAIAVTPRITQKVELKGEVEISDESIDDMEIPAISGRYIDNLEFTRKDELKDLFKDLYHEAIRA